MNDTSSITSMIRLRMGSHDAHYAGDLVDGAKMLQLFGDVATELLIRSDGDEGLFVAYDKVEFLAPVRAGDYIEAVGTITRLGKTSRAMTFEARKVITAANISGQPSACDVLDPPVVVCRASGTCVVPAECQRGALSQAH
ncbi:MAG: hotdog domain-containing protein [Rhodoferax sp.]